MTTTTDTDDTNPRLAALEADVRNINVQLERMHVEQQEARREQQAENRAMRAEFQAEIRAVNAKIDQLSAQVNARIERLTYLLLGGMVTVLAGIALLYFRSGG